MTYFKKSTLLRIGSLSMAMSVALGAIGAHVLKQHLSPKLLSVFKTGVEYQTIHSLAIIVLSMTPRELNLKWAATLFLSGIIFFSFGCYAYATSGIKGFVHIVPIGGFCFIAGWMSLFFSAKRIKELLNKLFVWADVSIYAAEK